MLYISKYHALRGLPFLRGFFEKIEKKIHNPPPPKKKEKKFALYFHTPLKILSHPTLFNENYIRKYIFTSK